MVPEDGFDSNWPHFTVSRCGGNYESVHLAVGDLQSSNVHAPDTQQSKVGADWGEDICDPRAAQRLIVKTVLFSLWVAVKQQSTGVQTDGCRLQGHIIDRVYSRKQ